MPSSADPAPQPSAHVAILPSAGMAHVTPFLRFASSLVSFGCRVTLLRPLPIVSSAESLQFSDFLSSHPSVHCLDLHLLPFDPSSANSTDPFCLQLESISRSAPHLLPDLLLPLDPKPSALVTDISLASSVAPVSRARLNLPCFILFISSSSMLSFLARFPNADDIPGSPFVDASMVPPVLRDPNNLFAQQFSANGAALVATDGVLVNTFDALEPRALAALNQGEVLEGLPHVFAIGPLKPLGSKRARAMELEWLDQQPERSVVYVSFGSRTALSEAQIKELARGLERSGFRFMWVVKMKIVDKEDEEGLEGLFRDGFMERVKERGLVVKHWVEQGEILAHRAVAAFMSHSGWNSVTEAAMHGVPMLVWPLGGDQRINAGVVEASGMGRLLKGWEWGCGGEKVVAGEVIEEALREIMEDVSVGAVASCMKDEAVRAVGVGGSSRDRLTGLIEKWSKC
ncbi:Anthocyanidin 5,3-O-glucosyltransferase [Acorus gramineus]|uniref:Glycosyltransferase n=1 Tax=Acorus gramineus TaxID=55184 RepID=A0AAV9B9U0_ACOGR|nr:Anthocyanidin 5,3-O-glucosyltransferase [Acorus gramineus]